MGEINPIRISGNWLDGYAIDYHSVNSIYLGDDEKGRPQFDTIRTDIGNLIYEMKYRNDYSNVDEIIKLIAPFVDRWNIDFIIPVPASKQRIVQPIYEISDKLGKYLDKGALISILQKNSSVQSKNIFDKKGISGTITKRKKFKRNVNLLIVDDLFDSGKTMTEVVEVLRTDDNVRNIYVLTMTKTRR